MKGDTNCKLILSVLPLNPIVSLQIMNMPNMMDTINTIGYDITTMFISDGIDAGFSIQNEFNSLKKMVTSIKNYLNLSLKAKNLEVYSDLEDESIDMYNCKDTFLWVDNILAFKVDKSRNTFKLIDCCNTEKNRSLNYVEFVNGILDQYIYELHTQYNYDNDIDEDDEEYSKVDLEKMMEEDYCIMVILDILPFKAPLCTISL